MTRGSLVLACLTVTSLVLGACGDEGDNPTTGRSSGLTTVPAEVSTTLVETTVVDTTTTAPPTTVAETTTTVAETTTTTTPPRPTVWEPSADWPTLADLPCCTANWVGTPSPLFPDDPAAALPPGTYFPARASQEALVGPSIDLLVRRFESCQVMAAEINSCEDNGGFTDTDMGVVPDPARELSFPLDDSTTVVFTGFDCTNGPAAHWSISGTGFAQFSAAFDDAYQTLLAGPFLAGETQDALVAALSATPTGGFGPLTCENSVGTGALLWQWDQSPEAGVLLQNQFPGDEANGFVPAPPPSAASYWLVPSALRVGDDGSLTLFVYAGFYS